MIRRSWQRTARRPVQRRVSRLPSSAGMFHVRNEVCWVGSGHEARHVIGVFATRELAWAGFFANVSVVTTRSLR